MRVDPVVLPEPMASSAMTRIKYLAMVAAPLVKSSRRMFVSAGSIPSTRAIFVYLYSHRVR